jgi:hypothetical protein
VKLPDEVASVFAHFRTCELTTLARDGSPITWPAAALWRAEEARFLLTTSIGLPVKAFNIRRNPKVSLYFSDPTGAELTSPPVVLVQGEAEASDRIHMARGLEEYWAMLFRRQPISRAYSWPGVRWFADWYYMRIVISVRPVKVLWWPEANLEVPPLQAVADDVA